MQRNSHSTDKDLLYSIDENVISNVMVITHTWFSELSLFQTEQSEDFHFTPLYQLFPTLLVTMQSLLPQKTLQKIVLWKL